jgi:PAS domain S-box-containing protein
MSAGFLADIIEHVAHPIFVKDRAFRFVLVNRALCEMVGYTREALLGQSDYDFFPRAEADYFRAKDTQVFATARPAVMEEAITDASGQRHTLATTKVPLLAPSGEVTHLVGIIHDITPLKRAEDRLRQTNEELERRVGERTAALQLAQRELVRKERLAVLGQLAGGLAHQIRNPLGSIKNAAHILQSALRTAENPDVARAIAVVHDEVEAANQCISDLLDYARVRPPLRQPAEVARLFEHALGAQEVPVRVRVVRQIDALPSLRLDAGQVHNALFNLVRNAVEAMPSGGTLTVRAFRDGAEAVLEVEDTGEGVPPEMQSQLFEPLATTKPLGLGLGLVTARALIENQGGSLRWHPTPAARGARFEVRLPCPEDASV